MRHKLKPLLSALLTIAMLLSLLPTAVFAAGGTGTFTKITTQEELTDGKYVIVVDSGYAMGALDGTWLTATQVTEEGGSLTGPDASLVWEIAVTDSGVTLTDANGTQVAPKGGNNNGIQAGDYTWAISFENGTFRFLGTGFAGKIPMAAIVWLVIAAVVISFPLMYRAARGAFEQVDETLIYAARTLGFSEWKIFWKVMLPVAMPGVLSGAILAFARGLGEFGATAMLAGNIAGKTQTLPLAIYSEVAAGKMSEAYKYVLIIVVISFLVVVLMNVLSAKETRAGGQKKSRKRREGL